MNKNIEKLLVISVITIISSLLANIITSFFTKEPFYHGYFSGVTSATVYLFLIKFNL